MRVQSQDPAVACRPRPAYLSGWAVVTDNHLLKGLRHLCCLLP